MNRLSQEKSPYLLQHKDNPVHWFAWGEAAFAEARRQEKPIFLSIGYSTCYWCHVMEKDSFEREDVALALNTDFICIKVDREERPDVDEIYMDAVIAMTGHGGWPMSVFLTPDGKPFYGGTYIPRERFISLLQRLAGVWKSQREDILLTGNNILKHLQEPRLPNHSGEIEVSASVFQHTLEAFEDAFDDREGGFGGAPKFPPSMSIALLLRLHRRTSKAFALDMAEHTLAKMACGGIFDQLGGGFHRYSTDEKWLVPHFEKMLYDNAMLAMAYCEAYQVTGKEIYADVVERTLAYVAREMTHPEGGFYSAQDAGEVKREGEFYVWEYEEIEALLSAEEFHACKDLFGVSRSGNFEDAKNIFHLSDGARWAERKSPLLQSAAAKLFAARARRPAPHLDDKVLVSWNGLMIAAYAKAYQVFRKPEYLAAAQKSAGFLQQKLWRDGKLSRRYRDGDSSFTAVLEDYAFLIHGLLHLFESDFNPDWLDWARELQRIQDEQLWDPRGAAYFTATAADETLIYRKKDTGDNALPSGNSIAALNLLRLYQFTYEKSYREQALQLLAYVRPAAERFPLGYAQALSAFDFATDSAKAIAIMGSLESLGMQALLHSVWDNFVPNRVVAAGRAKIPLLEGKEGDSARAYVCENQTCQNPTMDPKELLRQVSSCQPLVGK